MNAPHKTGVHVPVLLHEVVDELAVAPGDTVVDCTLGNGGHARALLAQIGPQGRLIVIDLDRSALARFADTAQDPRVTTLHGSFKDLPELMKRAGATHCDKLLADLGLSSDELERAGRGFSFQRDEPLLMTFDDAPGDETLTAREVVNEWAEESLADVLYGFGGERRARAIARAIALRREQAPIESSGELAAIVRAVVPRRGKTDPATKTFQAIRMAVNDELGALHKLLENVPTLLAEGGRASIISFHSLEDRIVKQTFRALCEQGVGHTLHKRPTKPSTAELKHNPRARSALLRTFVHEHAPHEHHNQNLASNLHAPAP